MIPCTVKVINDTYVVSICYSFLVALYMYIILQVDVIVNSTTTSLDLDNGALSASILEVGGNTLQEECKKVAPEGIKLGEVVVTSGGQLPCQFVVHGAASSWTDEQCTEVQCRHDFILVKSVHLF